MYLSLCRNPELNSYIICNVKDIVNYYSDDGLCYLKIILGIYGMHGCIKRYVYSDEYRLYSVQTIKKFRLRITPLYILNACKYGCIDILDFCFIHYRDLLKEINPIDLASEKGHTNVLQWWLEHELPLTYTIYAIDQASLNGHVDVLEWWRKSNLKLEYTNRALDLASYYNKVDVIKWWFKSNLPLKYDHSIINASENGHIEVLELWSNSKLPLKSIVNACVKMYSNVYETPSLKGYVNVLNWWKQLGVDVVNRYYSNPFLDIVSISGRINVLNILEWWKNSGLQMKYSDKLIDLVLYHNKIDVLHWWYESGLPLKYSEKALNTIRRKKYFNI
jgi:hypothetical protein